MHDVQIQKSLTDECNFVSIAYVTTAQTFITSFPRSSSLPRNAKAVRKPSVKPSAPGAPECPFHHEIDAANRRSGDPNQS